MKNGAILLISLFMCVQGFSQEKAEHFTAHAKIQPLNNQSKVTGKAAFQEVPGGVMIHVRVWNAPPGDHGLHIHAYGDVSNEGKNAGDHYNPESAPHGFIPSGDYTSAHAGDLGNISIDQNGNGKLDLFVPGLSIMGGKYNIAGRSVIFHEKKDDFGQPAGNTGGRIGGGTITVVGVVDN